MWSPTHVQVLVKRAKGLKIKGKDGTNDAFVTIGIGKEKYQTSVKEKATESVEWCEQCELSIPSHGNTAEIALTALHRNFMGVDEFLGLVSIPLREFDVYDRPRTRWYPLKCKPGQNKTDYRGDLEVRVSFTVKAVQNQDHGGSTASIANKNKHKGSLQSLNKAAANLGGSLLNIGSKEKKNLKKFAKSVSHKVEKVGDKAKKSLSKANVSKPDNDQGANEGTLPNKFSLENDKYSNRNIDSSLGRKVTDPFSKLNGSRGSGRRLRNQDPGVNSDEEDGLDDDDMLGFDALSHRSSRSSINVAKVDNLGTVSNTSTPLSGSLENIGGGELLRKIGTPNMRRGFIHNESPLATPKSSKAGMGESANEQMDEWELKLLGKKGVPFHSANNSYEKEKYNANQQNRDNLSQISGLSFNSGGGISQSSSRNNTLERKRYQPEKPLAVPEESPGGHKKKIITVGSDFESSPSPEETPSPPVSARKNKGIDYSRELEAINKVIGVRSEQEYNETTQPPVLGRPPFKSDSFKYDTKSNRDYEGDENHRNSSEKLTLSQKHKKLAGNKWKNSLSFREKDHIPPLNASGGHKISNESLTRAESGIHNRTYSDGGSSIGSSTNNNYPPPPSGPRVVLGRETTPTMSGGGSSHNITNARQGETAPTKIPKEVWDRFEGKSREDLIEMIVGLQSSVESQARKQSDMEDYIDSLLTKVLSTAPQLLQKNINHDNETQQLNNKNSVGKQTGKQALFKTFGIKW